MPGVAGSIAKISLYYHLTLQFDIFLEAVQNRVRGGGCSASVYSANATKVANSTSYSAYGKEQIRPLAVE